jgi:non-homologous end joining protein Ku
MFPVRNQWLPVTEEELAALQPTDEKTIYLEHFLDPALVDLVLFAGRTLYLAPAIGQPWLTILIDYYSRLAVGFCPKTRLRPGF